MQRLAMTILVSISTALIMTAQSAKQEKSPYPTVPIRCKNVNGQGCTQREVQALSDAVFAGKSKHDALLPVKDVALAASDGTLRCAQSDGTVCTIAELDIIKEIAADLKLTIRYTPPAAKK